MFCSNSKLLLTDRPNNDDFWYGLSIKIMGSSSIFCYTSEKSVASHAFSIHLRIIMRGSNNSNQLQMES